ncbi:MAG TPA: hypothetical protein VK273_06245 [Gaiellaceae bacterium]|nr:hypothetical protein [Gaiellaceae bacterium]
MACGACSHSRFSFRPHVGRRNRGLADASDVLGDIRAVLYVSQTTQLPMRTLIDMPMKIAGQTIVMHIDLVITAVNRPVAIPSVG